MTRLSALVVTLPLTLLACAADTSAPPPGIADSEGPTASTSEALTVALPPGTTNITTVASVDEGGCRISVGTATLAGPPWPPQWIAWARRSPVPLHLCVGTGYQILRTSYATPTVALAEGAQQQIAVSVTFKVSPSGSSPTNVGLYRLDPTTLATLETDGMAISPVGCTTPEPRISASSIVFTVPGDLLVVGHKDCTLPGEHGAVGGPSYQATFASFATSTTSNVAPSQVLAW